MTGLERIRTVEGEAGLGGTGSIGADSLGLGFKVRSMGGTVEEGEGNGGSSLGNTGAEAKVSGTNRDKTLE